MSSTALDLHSGPIGFIGLGIMGAPMARNLLAKANRTLVVWNRDPSKSESLRAAFPSSVTIAPTPADVISSTSLTYSMLSTPEAALAVFHTPPHSALAAITPGKALVDCSTLTVAASQQTAAAVSARGGAFLEAPVSGSKAPAESGALVFLCAGDRAVFDAQGVVEDLAAMGKRAFFHGAEVGAGTRMKLVVNQTMGVMLEALAEGMVLAEGAGLDTAELLEVLGLGAMANPMFALKGPKMRDGVRDYAPNFPLEHAQKDMRFAGMLAEECDVAMPVAAAANEVFKAAKAAGYGREDFSAVIEVLRKPSKSD